MAAALFGFGAVTGLHAANGGNSAATGAATLNPSTAAGDVTGYAGFGSAVGDQMRLADLEWSEAQFLAFVDGLQASYYRRSQPFDAAAQAVSDRFAQRMQHLTTTGTPSAAAPADAAIDQYMRDAREGLGMQQSESGLLYLIVQAGAGPRPRLGDRIVLSFTVVAADGKTPVPQLTVQSQRVKVADLIPGLAEGVQLIALGGRAALVVPPRLSFPSGKWPAGVEVGTPLIFRVELEDILPAEKP